MVVPMEANLVVLKVGPKVEKRVASSAALKAGWTAELSDPQTVDHLAAS